MRRAKKSNKVKIRKSVRTFYVSILVCLSLISILVLYNSFNSKSKKNFIKENIYEYTNKYFYSYDILMLENNYVNKENLGDKNVYITDLMDIAKINMTYVYNANQNSDVLCTYRIIGNLEAIYSKDGQKQKVLKDTEVLVDTKDINKNSDSTVEINENFDLNLKEKIEMIKGFKEELGMQIETTYTILLEVTTSTSVMGQEVTNVYTPDLVFEISPKTTTVKTNAEENSRPQIVTKLMNEKDEFAEIKCIIATFVFILSIALLIVLLIKTKNNNTIKNNYKIELNKILKECGEKIVEVGSKIDTEGQNIIDIKDFDEIIKVSEELFKPILYWNDENEEKSWFCVMGSNIIYRFILKR